MKSINYVGNHILYYTGYISYEPGIRFRICVSDLSLTPLIPKYHSFSEESDRPFEELVESEESFNICQLAVISRSSSLTESEESIVTKSPPVEAVTVKEAAVEEVVVPINPLDLFFINQVRLFITTTNKNSQEKVDKFLLNLGGDLKTMDIIVDNQEWTKRNRQFLVTINSRNVGRAACIVGGIGGVGVSVTASVLITDRVENPDNDLERTPHFLLAVTISSIILGLSLLVLFSKKIHDTYFRMRRELKGQVDIKPKVLQSFSDALFNLSDQLSDEEYRFLYNRVGEWHNSPAVTFVQRKIK